jgi:hypothetical protein
MADGPGYSYGLPLGHATKSLQRYAAKHGVDAELRAAAQRFAAALRQRYSNDAKRLATVVDQVCSVLPQPEKTDEPDEPRELRQTPTPAVVGSPLILTPLKTMLGILAAEAAPETTVCRPDRYARCSSILHSHPRTRC